MLTTPLTKSKQLPMNTMSRFFGFQGWLLAVYYKTFKKFFKMSLSLISKSKHKSNSFLHWAIQLPIWWLLVKNHIKSDISIFRLITLTAITFSSNCFVIIKYLRVLKWPWTMWTINFPNTSEWLNVNIVFDHFYTEKNYLIWRSVGYDKRVHLFNSKLKQL